MMKRKYLLLVVLALLLACMGGSLPAQAAPLAPDPTSTPIIQPTLPPLNPCLYNPPSYPGYGANAGQTSVGFECELTTTSELAHSWVSSFAASTDLQRLNVPVVHGNYVYYYHNDASGGHLYVKNYTTNDYLWTRHFPNTLGPLTYKDQLFTVDSAGTLYAINPLTGADIWTNNTHLSLWGNDYAPVIYGSMILVSGYKKWSAFRKSDGSLIFNKAESFEVHQIVAGSNTIFLPLFNPDTLSYRVIAYDTTGVLIWQSAIWYGSTKSRIVYDGTRLYLGRKQSGGNELVALNATTGSLVWMTSLPRGLGVEDKIAVYGDALYVTQFDTGTIISYNTLTGALNWTAVSPAGLKHTTGPVLAKGVLYIGSVGRLSRLNPTTGTYLPAVLFTGEAKTQPSVTGGRVFLFTHNPSTNQDALRVWKQV